jgi:ADP-ribosylglycohydrolase
MRPSAGQIRPADADGSNAQRLAAHGANGDAAHELPLEDHVEHQRRDERDHDAGEQQPVLAHERALCDSRETIPATLALCLLADGDPTLVVIYDANFGRDTDTIATMAGAICGALKGPGARLSLSGPGAAEPTLRSGGRNLSARAARP